MSPLKSVANLERVQRKATKKIKGVKKKGPESKSQGLEKLILEKKVKEITDFWSSATGGTFHRRWPPALHLTLWMDGQRLKQAAWENLS